MTYFMTFLHIEYINKNTLSNVFLTNYNQMPLNQKDIDELKEIYFKEFGETIPNDEAWEMGRNLLQLFSIITRPLPKNKNEEGNQNILEKKGQLSLF